MPPVKMNWKLIAETAQKDAASANARLTAANNALDDFRAEVTDALDALRKRVLTEIKDGRPVEYIAEDVAEIINATIAALTPR